MKRLPFFLSFAVLVFCSPPALADVLATYPNLHAGVSIASAVSVTEEAAIRFGNFAVGNEGGGDADIVLDHDGIRTSHNGASTTITLLNGGMGGDPGSQGPGIYHISGAASGTWLYIYFVNHNMTTVDTPNPVVLTGPVGSDEFYVDGMTFDYDGFDDDTVIPDGHYIVADGTGKATVHVGATLHTKAGATSYAPGKYTGTFEILVGY
ncbi:MAG: DUF4402 domain-containing protein [Pseudomonadota bacterium]